MLKIKYNEKYQLFYLKKAITELLNENNKNNIKSIKEDHLNGCNYINNIKIPITFPNYIKKYIDECSKDKNLKYFYKGTIGNTKRWILNYNNYPNSIVKKSFKGRTKEKYTIDKEYYKDMSRSYFTLCPTNWGNKKISWTYRFFEAIMCLSIPILENNSNDIYMKDYFFFFDKDEHIYDKDKAIENYNKFIKSKHFIKNIPELENLFKTPLNNISTLKENEWLALKIHWKLTGNKLRSVSKTFLKKKVLHSSKLDDKLKIKIPLNTEVLYIKEFNNNYYLVSHSF